MDWIKVLAMATSLIALPAMAGQAVNVNAASAEEIASSLDGVGQVKAERIVAYRETNGKFEHPDELVNVKGIGLRTIDRNRDFIKLEKQATN